jgi:hypothetical protein
MLTAAFYRLQNKWEEIFDVAISWHRVNERVQKRHLIQHLRVFNLNYYIQFLPPTECYIYGAYTVATLASKSWLSAEPCLPAVHST